MRTLMTAILLSAAAGAAHAQSLEAKRDAKLKSPFLAKASWITDYDQARAESAKAKKLIFAYFTRSYAQ